MSEPTSWLVESPHAPTGEHVGVAQRFADWYRTPWDPGHLDFTAVLLAACLVGASWLKNQALIQEEERAEASRQRLEDRRRIARLEAIVGKYPYSQ